MKLDIRDFFDAFDRGDPYMKAAVSNLQEDLVEQAPDLLDSSANWYKIWSLAGKRNLTTGRKGEE